ncbi:MAG: response regulator transcription factor [Candidatus Gastranaerophilales bacterium]|nr:response regulator transcription factor [Candidatus Gastranaerophilales bacterium]
MSKLPINLMLVEDHKLMRVGMKTLFEESPDFQVIAESGLGKEAVEKAKIHKPDVILMDIGLPDISGLTATKRILEDNPDAKIIILTSHNTEDEVNNALTIGAFAYVIKDINTDTLMMIIKSVNEGAIWLDPKIVPILRQKNGTIIPKKQTTRAAFRSQHANLTEREYEVLKLVVDGKSNNDIAHTLSISEHTAKAHVCNIIQKLVVDDRTQAAVKAIKEGLV